jgi:hypothetical protein
MNNRVEKACGIDVHQAFLAATILTSAGIKDTREFSTSLEGLLDLKTWILENGCQRVAIESESSRTIIVPRISLDILDSSFLYCSQVGTKRDIYFTPYSV